MSVLKEMDKAEKILFIKEQLRRGDIPNACRILAKCDFHVTPQAISSWLRVGTADSQNAEKYIAALCEAQSRRMLSEKAGEERFNVLLKAVQDGQLS